MLCFEGLLDFQPFFAYQNDFPSWKIFSKNQKTPNKVVNLFFINIGPRKIEAKECPQNTKEKMD